MFVMMARKDSSEKEFLDYNDDEIFPQSENFCRWRNSISFRLWKWMQIFHFLTYLVVPSLLFWHRVASLSPIKSPNKKVFISTSTTDDKMEISANNEKSSDEKFFHARTEWIWMKRINKAESNFAATKWKSLNGISNHHGRDIKNQSWCGGEGTENRKEFIIEMETRQIFISIKNS